jgi:hypothetical protein
MRPGAGRGVGGVGAEATLPQLALLVLAAAARRRSLRLETRPPSFVLIFTNTLCSVH